MSPLLQHSLSIPADRMLQSGAGAGLAAPGLTAPGCPAFSRTLHLEADL
jgi:hypothetical protein